VFGTGLLGELLLDTGGSGVQEALRLLREAGQRGSNSAITRLIDYAKDQQGNWKKGEPKDERISDLNTLTAAGDRRSLFTLYGVCRGIIGDPEKYKDLNRAFKMLNTLKSRESGNSDFLKSLNSYFAEHYMYGWGVSKNYQLGFKLAQENAMQGDRYCFDLLRYAYANGHGVPKSNIHSYSWALLASAEGIYKNSHDALKSHEYFLSQSQIAEAQKLAQALDGEIKRNKSQGTSGSNSSDSAQNKPAASGTGFFLSENGYIATNFHVVSGAKKISVRTANGEMGAVMVIADQVNDVAVIKAPVLGKPLPIGDVSAVVAGTPVYTVGFPNPVVQGFEPKLTKGDINSTTGSKDDPRMFQISVPVQPGNSGGPLLNERGTVIGIITAQLNSMNALVTSGALPQNVNYALKVNYLKPLIESNKELREAVDGSKSKEKEAKPPETAMESVLLILVEK